MAGNVKLEKDISKLVIPNKIKKELEQKLPKNIPLYSISFWGQLIDTMGREIIKLTGLLNTAKRNIEHLNKIEKEYEQIKKPVKTAEAIKLLKEEGFKIEINAKE